MPFPSLSRSLSRPGLSTKAKHFVLGFFHKTHPVGNLQITIKKTPSSIPTCWDLFGRNSQMICCIEVPLFTVSDHRRKEGKGDSKWQDTIDNELIDFKGLIERRAFHELYLRCLFLQNLVYHPTNQPIKSFIQIIHSIQINPPCPPSPRGTQQIFRKYSC